METPVWSLEDHQNDLTLKRGSTRENYLTPYRGATTEKDYHFSSIGEDFDTSLLSPMSSPSHTFTQSIPPSYNATNSFSSFGPSEGSHSFSTNTSEDDSDLDLSNDILEKKSYSKMAQCMSTLPVMLVMLFSSAITFYTPGVIPFLTDNDVQYFWLNGIFLIFPSFGAALCSFRKTRLYLIWIPLSLQFFIFLWMEIPAFSAVEVYYSNPFWLLVFLMCIFSALTGYINTMVYLKIRHSMNTGAMKTSFSLETLCRVAGFLSQVGGALGVIVNLLFISGDFYYDPVDDDDYHPGI